MPNLRATEGPYAGQAFPLSEGTIEVGRESDCGILLAQDGGLSRHHARLEVLADRVLVHDLGSRNGVFVNGSRTASTIVWPGDQIKLGNTVFVLESDPGQPVVNPLSPYAGTVPSQPPPIPPGGVVSSAPPPGYPTVPAPVPGAYPAGAGAYPAGSGAYPAGAGAYPPGTGMMPGMAPAPGFFGAYQPPKNDVPFARWLYFLAFSIPPLGLIFGLIYLLKETPEERAVGKWIMIWSVIGGIIAWLSWIALVGALHSLASQSGQLSGLLGGDPTGGAASTLNHAVPSSYSNSMGGIPAR